MSVFDKTTCETNEVVNNLVIISNNQINMLLFLKKINQDLIALFFSEILFTKIDFQINQSLLDFENICKDQDDIYKHICSIFDKLTNNIKLLIHVQETNKAFMLILENNIKAILYFNIILKNDAIIKEYISSIREILSNCIMSIENARFKYYKMCIQKANTNTTTDTNNINNNKKRKLDDNNDNEFWLSLAAEAEAQAEAEIKAKKSAKKSFYLDKVKKWLKQTKQ
jgi:hypothetical protein